MDAFICGVCHVRFTSIEDFMIHKKRLPDSYACNFCGVFFHCEEELNNHNQTHLKPVQVIEQREVSSFSVVPGTVDDELLEKGAVIQIVCSDGENLFAQAIDPSDETAARFLQIGEGESTQMLLSIEEVKAGEEEKGEEGPPPLSEETPLADCNPALSGSERIYACRLCPKYSPVEVEILKHLHVCHGLALAAGSLEVGTYLQCLHAVEPAEDEREKRIIQLENLPEDSTAIEVRLAADGKVFVGSETNSSATLKVTEGRVDPEVVTKPNRRKGRPRKCVKDREVETKKLERCRIPVLGTDGKYHCKHCRKSFNKERHFLGHRCFGMDNAIDFYAEDASTGAETTGQGQDEEDDTSPDFKISQNLGRQTKRQCMGERKTSEVSNKEAGAELSESGKENSGLPEVENTDPAAEAEEIVGKDGGHYLSEGVHVPVFNNEGEKLAFEEYLRGVDLSSVEHLFTKHAVEHSEGPAAPLNWQQRRYRSLDVYSCNVCSRVFKDAWAVRGHCLGHTDSRPYRCPLCPYAASAKANLYTHMRRHTGNYFACRRCDFRCCNRSHMLEHERTHDGRKHACLLCEEKDGRKFNTRTSLVNHVRKYHGSTRQGRDYLRSLLKRGRQEGRGEDDAMPAAASTLYACSVCQRKFKKKVDRDRHMAVHKMRFSSLVFGCELCDYVTSRKAYFHNHIRRHRLVFVCHECRTTRFLSSALLRKHLEQVHGEEGESMVDVDGLFQLCIASSWYLPEPNAGREEAVYSSIPEDLIGSEDSQKPQPSQTLNVNCSIFKLDYRPLTTEIYAKIKETFGKLECEFCGLLFHSKADLEPHSNTHVPDKPFKCTLCTYSSATKDNLKRHVESQHERKKYACPECDFIATNRTSLWTHTKKHKPVNPSCSECGDIFSDYGQLRDHLAAVHPTADRSSTTRMIGYNHRINGRLGKQLFKCPHCERSFPRNSKDLKKHMWIHEGVKPFKCSQCPYSCRSENNLNVHMIRHSADKPFRCSTCGKGYKSKASMRCHERFHTGNGKPLQCPKCDYRASQVSHLKRHLETHGSLHRRYGCAHCDYKANTMPVMRAHYSRKHKGMPCSVLTSDDSSSCGAELDLVVEGGDQLAAQESLETTILGGVGVGVKERVRKRRNKKQEPPAILQRAEPGKHQMLDDFSQADDEEGESSCKAILMEVATNCVEPEVQEEEEAEGQKEEERQHSLDLEGTTQVIQHLIEQGQLPQDSQFLLQEGEDGTMTIIVQQAEGIGDDQILVQQEEDEEEGQGEEGIIIHYGY